ncbi:MAG TPA: BRO family protein [Azoarcus taiwanensis]|nr:BRO family protein [Azoarcus taiwanensis]
MNASAPSVFQFHTQAVRIFPTDDGLSFVVVAKDVANILGYRDAEKFLRLVPAERRGTRLVGTSSGDQMMSVVDEPGLYRGILRSDRREAEPLMEWVTAEVLPSIRRTGAYARPAQLDLAHEIGALRDELRAQGALVLELYRKLDGARRGHIAAQRGQLAALREVAAVRNAQHAQAVQAGIDAVLEMEAAGVPREEIARATGKTRNYIRQIVYRARAGRGGQGELALEG